jgi:hypothetical protein
MDRRFDIRPEELHGLRGSVGRRLVGRVVVPAVIIYAVLVGVGLLLAHPLARLVSGEDGLNRELVGERSPVWTTVTAVFSALANTPAVVGVVIAVALAMRLIFGRWAESIILVTAVLLQAAVFLLTTTSTASGPQSSTWTRRRPHRVSRPGTPGRPRRSTSGSPSSSRGRYATSCCGYSWSRCSSRCRSWWRCLACTAACITRPTSFSAR